MLYTRHATLNQLYASLKTRKQKHDPESNSSSLRALPVCLQTTADVKSSVGTYPISVKDAVAVNYNITAPDGTLASTVLPLTVRSLP